MTKPISSLGVRWIWVYVGLSKVIKHRSAHHIPCSLSQPFHALWDTVDWSMETVLCNPLLLERTMMITIKFSNLTNMRAVLYLKGLVLLQT